MYNKMYPNILQAIVKDVNKRFKYSVRTLGNLFGIGKSTIHRWIKYKDCISKKNRVRKYEVCSKIIKEIIITNPDSRLKDIQICLVTNYNIRISLSCICRYLRELGISRKKITFQQFSNWDDLQCKREKFKKDIEGLDKNSIISIDESYFYKRLYRSYGYSLKGSKAIVPKRIGMKKFSLLMAISSNRILAYDIVSTNVNRYSFYSFLKDKLLPECKNKILLMDNASFHKCKEIVQLIVASGNSVLFIPPYSPEFNPIEVVFRMFKSRLSTLSIITIDDIINCLNDISIDSLKRIYKHSLG